ncbi:hatching enzyme 1.2-like [Labeo rohita]|uniref:hatching enzyme 1.2-like n=1 Tax=Labeo rohita TaxID=84645 RepID=UPI0021E3062E|nr:hatching enzyme 1.2-like [Labeo rohita]
MASLHTLLILCVCTTALCLPKSSLIEIDVDDGKDWDIFDINQAAGLHLVEGDILIQEGEDRNTILDEKYRWPTSVPYVLDSSLEINAKGVILKAFEEFRLKTCIDFKPRCRERNYIFIFKDKGIPPGSHWSHQPQSLVPNHQPSNWTPLIPLTCTHISTCTPLSQQLVSRSQRWDYLPVSTYLPGRIDARIYGNELKKII